MENSKLQGFDHEIWDALQCERRRQEENIDLIAMTTHGRTGLSRWVYGSVTEKVLHSVSLTMLIVRTLDNI